MKQPDKKQLETPAGVVRRHDVVFFNKLDKPLNAPVEDATNQSAGAKKQLVNSGLTSSLAISGLALLQLLQNRH